MGGALGVGEGEVGSFLAGFDGGEGGELKGQDKDGKKEESH